MKNNIEYFIKGKLFKLKKLTNIPYTTDNYNCLLFGEEVILLLSYSINNNTFSENYGMETITFLYRNKTCFSNIFYNFMEVLDVLI